MVKKQFKPKQLTGETNLAVLGYLMKYGTWINLGKISTGTPGSDLERTRLKKKLDGFIKKGFIEYRPSKNPQAKHEYKIKEFGKDTYKKMINLTPEQKFLVGLPENESE